MNKYTRNKLGQFKKGAVPWNKGRGVFKNCLTCNKRFYIIKSRVKEKKGKFCSIECKKNYQKILSKKYKLNPFMAELIGVIIGDGCISKYWKRKDYRIFISGNPIEDKDYMEIYLPKLIKKCIKKELKPFKASNGAYLLQFQNESFRLFLDKLNIKEKKTKKVRIPDPIKKNPKLLKKCIKGIADTDFTLIFTKHTKDVNHYPRITAQFASKNLVKDLEKALREMSFTLNVKYDYKIKDKRGYKWTTNQINLDGPHNLKRWMKLIGFSNYRIISRYNLWKKNNYLKPKTSLPERKQLLNVGITGGGEYGR